MMRAVMLTVHRPRLSHVTARAFSTPSGRLAFADTIAAISPHAHTIALFFAALGVSGSLGAYVMSLSNAMEFLKVETEKKILESENKMLD